MTKQILAILLLASFNSEAQVLGTEQATLNLIDPETRSASDVDVGEGLKAIVDLPMIPDHKRLDIELLVYPEFKLDEAPLYEKRYRSEKSEIDVSWRKVFKIPSFHNKEEILKRFGRVGRLRISWKDPQTEQSGVLIRKFYLLENKEQKFFKILDPQELREANNADPESICSYRKNLEIVGPYLQNPSLSPQEYEFNQSVSLETLRYRGPLNATAPATLGYVQKVAAPFQILNQGDLGWLMTGWTHYEGKDTKLTVKPKIVLQAAQGGYFIKETLVRRFKAQKYSFKKRNGSSEWVEENVGLLDVGNTQFDFITLRFEDSQDPALLEANLQERSALMTTCKDYPAETDRAYHTGDSNSLHEEVFFRTL